MVVDPATSRAHFRLQVAELESQSRLLGAWCERVAVGAAISDAALVRIADGGHELESWIGVKKVFVAVLAVLQAHQDPLHDRVPTLGGVGRVDHAFDQVLTRFVDENLDEIVAFLPRMMVANDPSTGGGHVARRRPGRSRTIIAALHRGGGWPGGSGGFGGPVPHLATGQPTRRGHGTDRRTRRCGRPMAPCGLPAGRPQPLRADQAGHRGGYR